MSKQQGVSIAQVKFNIKYHYAHVIEYGKKTSIAEITDVDRGVIKINNSFIEDSPILVRFSSVVIAQIKTEEVPTMDVTDDRLPTMDIDMYSGTVAINIKATKMQLYDPPRGCIEQNPTYGSFGPQYLQQSGIEVGGYILESPLRMVSLLFKGLVVVENLY